MTTRPTFDLVVLGGGAAAFAAITEASRRGLSTAIVNEGLPLGGTCVNVGCVPSKHLLAAAHVAFEPPRNPFKGVRYDGSPAIDWGAALDDTAQLVRTLRQENYIDVADHFATEVYEGYGRVARGTTIDIIDGPDAGSHLYGDTLLIATGSSPWIAPIEGIDAVEYETSESILERREFPASVIVIGGGYVGLEWGQILHRFGAEVIILQRSSDVLSRMDHQLGRAIARYFREEGISVVTGVDFRQVRATADGVAVETIVEKKPREFDAETLFVATGVRPNTDGIGLETVGVETNARGAIVVDEYYQSTAPGIYAAGDVIGEPMLETVAAKEGNHAMRNAFGDERKTIDYASVPAVIFTSPEIASVGWTEEAYMAEHGTCSCRTVRMVDLPKAKAVGDTRGFLQVVKHHETDEIVGVHMVTPRAADMVSEATFAVKFGLTVDDIIDTVHPFPTFSEAFKQACQAFRRDISKMSCCIE